jgi:hypothetical protein
VSFRGHGARTILPTRKGCQSRAFAHPTIFVTQ